MKVYSLSRLARLLSQQKNGRVKVGGRVIQLGGKYCLSSATHILHLDGAFTPISFEGLEAKLNEGQFAVVELDISNLKLEAHGQPLELNWDGQCAEAWEKFLDVTRMYLKRSGLREVTTPTLVQNPGMEPELEPFGTLWRSGNKEMRLFLTTSPEQHLKQLLAAGHTDIFEIKTVYRNEELSEVHEPEFQMLEWYRGFAGLDWIEADLIGLMADLKEHGFAKTWETPERASMGDLFRRYLNFSLTPETTREDLLQLAGRLGERPGKDETWNDLFHRIYVGHLEPQLPSKPLIVFDFPPSQAALSRINERGFADRFELYWQGIEIANAFGELTDAHEQRARFERDQKLREVYRRTPLSIDENFMRALKDGIPPSGGIALGLDRLFMLATSRKTIAETRPFAFQYVIRACD